MFSTEDIGRLHCIARYSGQKILLSLDKNSAIIDPDQIGSSLSLTRTVANENRLRYNIKPDDFHWYDFVRLYRGGDYDALPGF